MKKLFWYYFNRHPVLYKFRFRLLSKESNPHQISRQSYNDKNKKSNIPENYFEINKIIFENHTMGEGCLSKAIHIATWLRNNIKGGPGFGTSSAIALEKMLNGEGGVCSDISQVYNNFCVINNIKVKEWGITVKPFSHTFQGHTFNEIYATELKKWVLIDVSQSIIFNEKNKAKPLSAIELFNIKRNGQRFAFSHFNKDFSFEEDKIKKNYFDIKTVPFVITNYCNKTYDYFLGKVRFLPVSIIHGILYLIGKSYYFEFPILKSLNENKKQVY